MLTRLYLSGDAARHRLASTLDAIWCGTWLGVFDRAKLHMVDAEYYASRDLYASDAHNRRGLFPWEDEALARHFPGRGSLLVVGAGGGREVLALSLRGYVIESYECHPGLRESARRLLSAHGIEADVRPMQRDRAPDGGAPVDGAIVGWSTYTLIAGRRHRIAFLRGLKGRISAGGPVLVSFFSRSGAERRLRLVHALAAALRAVLGAERPELGDDLSPNFVHRFTAPEIQSELAEAGFALEVHVPQGSGRFDSGYAVGRALDSAAPERLDTRLDGVLTQHGRAGNDGRGA